MHDSMMEIGVCDQDSIRCHGRLGGTSSHHQTFLVCGRALRVDKKGCGLPNKVAFGVCVCPRGHGPRAQDNFNVGLTGRLHHRSTPTNSTFRPIGARTRAPISKPLSLLLDRCNRSLRHQQKQADTADVAGTLLPFPHGLRVDLLKDFLRQFFSPGDFDRYMAMMEPEPTKEKPPIHQELTNRVQEKGKVLGQIEHHRNVPSSSITKSCCKGFWTVTSSWNKKLICFRGKLRLWRLPLKLHGAPSGRLLPLPGSPHCC